MHTPFFKLFNCSTVQLFGLTKLSHSILTFGRVCFRSGKLKQFEFFELRRDSA